MRIINSGGHHFFASLLSVVIISFLIPTCFGDEDGMSSKVPFSQGEKLTYQVIYMALPAGKAVLEVKEITNWEGHEVYRLTGKAWSSALFSLFYRVKDNVESLLDTKTFLPHRFEKNQKEGDYRNHEITTFNRNENVAVNFDVEDEETISVPVPPDAQDALSAFYHLRRQELKVGETVMVNVSADDNNYKVKVEVLKKEKLGKRKVETILVRPILEQVELGGILKSKGDIYVWLTDDEKRIPVLIKARVVIGSLSMILMDKEIGLYAETK